MLGTDDLPLFAREAPHNGTDTSRAAALDIRRHLGRLEQRVLVFIAGRENGATNDEIEAGLQMLGSTVRPRVVELRARGLIHPSGQTRPTRTGRQASVWVLTR